MNLEHANPELLAALSLAQGEIENAIKGSLNPHFKSKYADLAEILNTVRPVFSKHGLALIQSTEFDGSLVSVSTVITHASGGYVTSKASCVPAKSDAQGVGSSTTYLRRYSAASMAGIAQEDDDGQTASHNKKPEPVKQELNQAEQAALQEWIDSFNNADDLKVIEDLGKQLAKATMPEKAKAELRIVYSQAKAKYEVTA